MIKLLMIIMTVFVAGCLPLVQQESTTFSAMNALYVDNPGYLLVSFSADVYETKAQIVDELSYAVDPDGMKFKIKHEKHQYDIEQRRQYPRDRVFLLYDNGNTKTSLKNGIWKLIIFTRDMNDRSQEWTTEFKLSTFFYSPIFHGAPN